MCGGINQLSPAISQRLTYTSSTRNSCGQLRSVVTTSCGGSVIFSASGQVGGVTAA